MTLQELDDCIGDIGECFVKSETGSYYVRDRVEKVWVLESIE